MIKHITVKQKHLYTNEKSTLYKGNAHYTNDSLCTTLVYTEYDGSTEVCVEACDTKLCIHRNAEINSFLTFISGTKSKGIVMSEFGNIELDIYTHKYIQRENIIAIEYDILQDDEVIDGFRIIWDIKEELS